MVLLLKYTYKEVRLFGYKCMVVLPRRCRPQAARTGMHGALFFSKPYALKTHPELDLTSVVSPTKPHAPVRTARFIPEAPCIGELTGALHLLGGLFAKYRARKSPGP